MLYCRHSDEKVSPVRQQWSHVSLVLTQWLNVTTNEDAPSEVPVKVFRCDLYAPKNYSCSDCQQHCCRFFCQINSKQLIDSSFVDRPRAESHNSCYNEELICCSEWFECLSWSYTEFFSSARLNFYFYHYLSHRQHCWRVTRQMFQCFGDLNLNQRGLEQHPGLGGPAGGLRTVFIKFEIIIFKSPTKYKNIHEWYPQHFEDYMEAQDQIPRHY